MRIPNSFLTDFTSSAELKLACVFYGLINKNTKKNLLGWEITVKQSTLAALCGLSESTIKRTLKSLKDKGFICSQKRSYICEHRLGTYTYTIKEVPVNSGYFNIQKKAIKRLTGTSFTVYAHFCKLADKHRKFFQSLNELCAIIRIGKKELTSIIAKLIKDKLIRRLRRMTRCGDYTDNIYFVTYFAEPLRIRAKIGKQRTKKVSPADQNRGNNLVYRLEGTHKKLCINSIQQFSVFVNTLLQKISKKFVRRRYFIYAGGSG